MNDSTSNTLNRKNFILGLLALAIIAVVLLIVLRAKVTPPVTQPGPTPPVADSTLTLHLTQLNLPSGKTVKPSIVNVEINGGSHAITCAQFTLAYDPKALSNFTITPGDFLHNPTVLPSPPNTAKGQAPFAICNSLGAKPSSGKGVVAVVSFTVKPQSKGQTTITFTGKSLVAGANVKPSILHSTQNVVVPLSTQ